ncbi:glycosyltransferase family 1 protein [Flavobacterium silvisoli]|uniref:Glycosyltransferase family 1 protein n=1 Tax=Flavobacterium silvisoli TaxID=2529433 RepID=A0A4Q9YZK6_9FLAO|nr:glycosyltransferase [Flavobacterium silvisoli]TBX69241.1 glycosyltransferase family 1 protein [Flavobacterium silvisoli]
MRLLVISTAPLIVKNDIYFAYSPYAKEMVYWAKYADEIEFACSVWNEDRNFLNAPVTFPIHKVHVLREMDMLTLKAAFKAIWSSCYNCLVLLKAMRSADHIHLRCPGNISLLGAFLQVFFPKKIKTTKYAGNWDPKSKQPFSYRLQKWIVSNTFLTKNMQVLVYGEWENSTKNVKSFFTATYTETDKIPLKIRKLEGTISFVFVGTLSNGKQPLYAIQLVEELYRLGRNVQLTLYGEGMERKVLEAYIAAHQLESFVFLKGNQNQEAIKQAYIENHFVVLPSESEGWPKAVAEGMFWGCLPIATAVSCVPNMLDKGKRGILLQMSLPKDAEQIIQLLDHQDDYNQRVENAANWSRKYTLDVFENEIKMLLQS